MTVRPPTPSRPDAPVALRRAGARRGLTLLELIVVLAILVALSGMVVPLIQGLGYQTNASTNAAVVGDVNGSVGTFHTRFDKYPNEWDSLLNASDGIYSKLHPNLMNASPSILQTATLSDLQADSLNVMGVYQLRDHVEGSLSPNTTGTGMRSIAAGSQVVTLNKTSLTSSGTMSGELFSVRELSETNAANDYVVVGLGTATTMRGSVMTDVPLIHGADPSNHYARVLCVFMVPGTDSGATAFPAKYVGCFLPDGSSLRNNLDRYHNVD